MNKILISLALLLTIIFYTTVSSAAQVGNGKKILYIPIDNRPIILRQTVDVAEKLGYEVLTPPAEIIGSRYNLGNVDELWRWLNENAANVNAAVISTDAMIYGSLIASRQHEMSGAEILSRAKNFEQFKENFPALPIYAFGTIMRTPRAAISATYEPDYYKTYATQIFNYTALIDKSELGKLGGSDKSQIKKLEKQIPAEYLTDWLDRRAENYDANKYLIDLTRRHVFDYFILGMDDNGQYSQTHLESRHLADYAKDVGKSRFIVMSGADELGMMMMSRAINADLHEMPFVAVEYNDGKGKYTMPDYGSETAQQIIDGAIIATGGFRIYNPAHADFVVAVNTNFDGSTSQANYADNNLTPRKGTYTFIERLKNLTAQNLPVGVADITFGNGADNAMMNLMKAEDLQFKIRAYGGWNTASNSTGFLIGAGVLTKRMDDYDVTTLLMTRYLDDWAYQANVRTTVAYEMLSLPGTGDYSTLGERLQAVDEMCADKITKFAADNINLPRRFSIGNIKVIHPWNRMYEADVLFDLKVNR